MSDQEYPKSNSKVSFAPLSKNSELSVSDVGKHIQNQQEEPNIIKLEEKVQETDFVSPICLNLRLGWIVTLLNFKHSLSGRIYPIFC